MTNNINLDCISRKRKITDSDYEVDREINVNENTSAIKDKEDGDRDDGINRNDGIHRNNGIHRNDGIHRNNKINNYVKKLRKSSLQIPLTGQHIAINQILSKYSIFKPITSNNKKPKISPLDSSFINLTHTQKLKLINLLIKPSLADMINLKWPPVLDYIVLNDPQTLEYNDYEFHNMFKLLGNHVEEMKDVHEVIKKCMKKNSICGIIQAEGKLRKITRKFFIDVRYAISTIKTISNIITPILFAIYYRLIIYSINRVRINLFGKRGFLTIVEKYFGELTNVDLEIEEYLNKIKERREIINACLDNANLLIKRVHDNLRPGTRLKCLSVV